MATNATAVAMDTAGTATALVKTSYGSYMDALPDNELITNKIGFQKFEKLGRQFQVCVNLTYGHSVTAQGNIDQIMNLDVPVVTPLTNAEATSYVYCYRDIISQTILDRAMGNNPQSFESSVTVSLERAQKSFTKILEEVLNYGTLGLGTFTATTTDIGNGVVTIQTQQWAPGLWIGSMNMPVDIYTLTGIKVASVIIGGVPNGLAAMQLSIIGLSASNTYGLVNATQYNIFRKGFFGMEAPGLQAILTEATNLFGIPANGPYDLWQPNTYPMPGGSGSSLTFTQLGRGISLYRPKGLGKDLLCIIGENSFMDLMPDYNSTVYTNATPGPRSARLFMDEKDVAKIVHGAEEVKFKVNSTSITVESSPYQKQGYAPVIEVDSLTRIGSTDKAFKFQDLGGAAGQRYFRALENMTAYEFRLVSDCALFTGERNRSMIFTNILPNTPN